MAGKCARTTKRDGICGRAGAAGHDQSEGTARGSAIAGALRKDRARRHPRTGVQSLDDVERNAIIQALANATGTRKKRPSARHSAANALQQDEALRDRDVRTSPPRLGQILDFEFSILD